MCIGVGATNAPLTADFEGERVFALHHRVDCLLHRPQQLYDLPDAQGLVRYRQRQQRGTTGTK